MPTRREKPGKPTTRSINGDERYTTVSTRLNRSQLVRARDAARRHGWSLSQFVQRAAVERAAEIINRDENRSRITQVVRSVARAFGERPLCVTCGGKTWLTNDPGWEPTIPELDGSGDGRSMYVLQSGKYLAIKEESYGLLDVLTMEVVRKKRISVFRREDLPTMSKEKDAWTIPHDDSAELFEPNIPYDKALCSVEQSLPLATLEEVVEAIRHTGREFAELMSHELGEGDKRNEYVDARQLLGDSTSSGDSA